MTLRQKVSASFHGGSAGLTRRGLLASLSLLLATAIWVPTVHLLFQPDLSHYRTASGLPSRTRAIAAYQLRLWEAPAERDRVIQRMRASNAEWDFMGRTYLVLALANLALREPDQQSRYLVVIDQIIDETVRLEASQGQLFFLMAYARRRPFLNKRKRSIFVDGEIALMLAARQLVAVKPAYRPLLRGRIDTLTAQLAESPYWIGESYPDECWMFCNTVALAAIKISDKLDGRDHTELISTWLAVAQRMLIDAHTGLLVSSFNMRGDQLDGPEGSSIFMTAHCLQLIDPEFAADQYRRARRELRGQWFGFAFAREWPRSWSGPQDIDSGPTIPLIGANAGASGMAILGAAAFGDDDYLRALLTALNLAGFPSEQDGRLRYLASNQVGDALLLYALVQGPLWKKALAR